MGNLSKRACNVWVEFTTGTKDSSTLHLEMSHFVDVAKCACDQCSVWLNNFDWTTSFYWSCTLLYSSHLFLCALMFAFVLRTSMF